MSFELEIRKLSPSRLMSVIGQVGIRTLALALGELVEQNTSEVKGLFAKLSDDLVAAIKSENRLMGPTTRTEQFNAQNLILDRISDQNQSDSLLYESPMTLKVLPANRDGLSSWYARRKVLLQNRFGNIRDTDVNTFADITFSKTRQTFDNFMKYEGNQTARDLGLSIALSQFLKPTVLLSGAGLGKTHLLYAIGNYVIENEPEARVGLISAESFVSDYIQAIRAQNLDSFRKKYRDGYDLLLVDDLTAVFGKLYSEEELYRTLRHVEKLGGRVVIAAASLPANDEPHSSSEFHRWLETLPKVEISAPNEEARTLFINQYLASSEGFRGACANSERKISERDVVDAILPIAGVSFRELEGKLLQLNALALLSGRNDWQAALETLKGR